MSRCGLIPAAGFGSRQALDEGAVPKPLLLVAGKPLIFHALDALHRAECERAVIVLGFQAEVIRTFVQQQYHGAIAVDFVVNPQYQLQNGVSVLCARQRVDVEYVLMMADHVFESTVLDQVPRISLRPGEAALMVDYKLHTIIDPDDATKVLVESGKVIEIGKRLANHNAIDTGLFVAGDSLMDALQRAVDETGDASLSDGVRTLARRGMMNAIDIQAGRWQDVDTPGMVAAAESMLRPDSRLVSET